MSVEFAFLLTADAAEIEAVPPKFTTVRVREGTQV
jgi:hypothetical protein